MNMEQRATVMVKPGRQQVPLIAVEHKWFSEYTGPELGKTYRFFIAENYGDDSKITNLRCGVDYDKEELEEM